MQRLSAFFESVGITFDAEHENAFLVALLECSVCRRSLESVGITIYADGLLKCILMFFCAFSSLFCILVFFLHSRVFFGFSSFFVFSRFRTTDFCHICVRCVQRCSSPDFLDKNHYVVIRRHAFLQKDVQARFGRNFVFEIDSNLFRVPNRRNFFLQCCPHTADDHHLSKISVRVS
jgi:hypothetical protein